MNEISVYCEECGKLIQNGEMVRIVDHPRVLPDGDVSFDDFDLLCKDCTTGGKECIIHITEHGWTAERVWLGDPEIPNNRPLEQ